MGKALLSACATITLLLRCYFLLVLASLSESGLMLAGTRWRVDVQRLNMGRAHEIATTYIYGVVIRHGIEQSASTERAPGRE